MSANLHPSPRRQRGASAVELALIFPVLFFLTTVPLFLAVYYWHYSGVHKAAHDAARYLSTLSEQEMRDPVLALAARAIARDIVEQEIADLGFHDGVPKLTFLCGQINECDGLADQPLPQTVTVGIQLTMKDTLFFAIDTGRYGWTISAAATARYAGK